MNAFCLHDYDGLVGQKGFQDGPYVHLPKEEFIMEDCIFCKIIAGEIPSTKVWEDDNFFAFKDINPKAKVHVLVVPRKHYANVAELAAADPQQLAHMTQVAQNIADQEFHGAFRLIFNTGIDAGQTVFHVHAHVLTGEKLDE